MRSAFRSSILGAVAALALVLALPAQAAPRGREAPLPVLTPIPSDPLAGALRAGRVSHAQYALARAESLFRLDEVRRRFGDVAKPDTHDATFVLRDLALRAGELSGEERRRAQALLARPSDGAADPLGQGYDAGAVERRLCTSVCVHWVETTADAPPLADLDADRTPDWVETTLATLEKVRTTEVTRFRYRAPRSDLSSRTNGGDGSLDVYLADIGDAGYYGYCTTDDPHASPASGYAYSNVSAYCVLDDDFDAAQFPEGGGVQALRVTAAHEFFHAIQYAYDWLEDLWLMEGTAVWIEDEVYDGVNDSRSFLAGASALSRPTVPVDFGARGFEYGAWIFWRYLSERVGQAIVLDVWRKADAAPGGRDDYSVEAVKSALRRHHTTFRQAFAKFGVANRLRRYSEGSSYPAPPTSATYTLTPRFAQTGWRSTFLYHMTNRYVSFRPGTGVSRTTAALRVRVGLPRLAAGPSATLIVRRASGDVRVHRVRLDSGGDGAATVSFRRGAVNRVDLVLTNGSTRFDCFWDTQFSCAGLPRDDGRAFRFSARVV